MFRECACKLQRIRDYLGQNGYTGMVLLRQDNFNWITGGGNSRVIVPDSNGFAAVVVTPSQVFLVAQVMDGARIMDEEMANLPAEYVPLKWFQEPVLSRALALAGKCPVTDVPGQDAAFRLREIYQLHFPLTDSEIATLEELGALSDGILTKVAGEIRPGITDYEVEARLLYEFALHNVQCDVLLIGTDRRIFQYRHPNPVGARLDRYVLLHAAARLRGLHCNITRSVYFGDKLPEEIARAFHAVSRVAAHNLSRCAPGSRWHDILEGHKAILKQEGFEGEWQGHYPGGRTGYFVCQADLSLDPENRVVNREAYDWFITVTGAKVEELGISADGALRMPSHTGVWPSSLDFEAGGNIYSIPQVWVR